MEKCTFCVQRIQQARIKAKREGRSIVEGEIQPACQQSCPSRAITFGDLNDPASRVTKLWSSPRAFRALEELGAKPSISYLAVVKKEVREDGGGESA